MSCLSLTTLSQTWNSISIWPFTQSTFRSLCSSDSTSTMRLSRCLRLTSKSSSTMSTLPGTTTSTTLLRPSNGKHPSTEKLSTILSTISGIDPHSQDNPLTMSTHVHPFLSLPRTRKSNQLALPTTTPASLELLPSVSLLSSGPSTRSRPPRSRLSQLSSPQESTSSSKTRNSASRRERN